VPRVNPQPGETWFVLLWHGGVVLAVRVDEVTEHTVVLWAQSDCGSRPATRAYRYRTRDVTWLERIEEAASAAGVGRPLTLAEIRGTQRFPYNVPVLAEEIRTGKL
jgi:hypothetical protein